MPSAPLKACQGAGCRELCHTSYCEKCAGKRAVIKRIAVVRYDAERGTATFRGYTAKWSAFSKIYRRNNPLCVMCLKDNKLTPVFCVDHITPISGPDDPEFYDESNLQALCLSCHSRKTAEENCGFGNTGVREL
jgi:5-methylcytosine-specific restriction enzyme A